MLLQETGIDFLGKNNAIVKRLILIGYMVFCHISKVTIHHVIKRINGLKWTQKNEQENQ